MAEPHRHTVEYFSVLARVRHLLPEALTVLDHRAILDPDRMADAIRMCGTDPEWERFDSEDVSHFKRIIDAIEGDVYVIGDSVRGPGLQVVQAAQDEFESIRQEVDVCSDITLIGVAAPTIGLVHHEARCTVVRCVPGPGLHEDPRDLERRLLGQVEQRREEALNIMPPPVRQGVLAILEGKRRIDAIKYLRTELGCSLVDAKGIVDAIDAWWPR